MLPTLSQHRALVAGVLFSSPDARVLVVLFACALAAADVDDLEEIGNLEGYIERTNTILVYCSRGYFNSKNCMRELVASVQKAKPIIALIDTETAHGGLNREEVHRCLMAAEGSYAEWGFGESTPSGQELYDHLFLSNPIEWNRIGDI